MAFTVYENLTNPNDVLQKIRDFAVDSGWTVLENLTDDLPIDGTSATDGKRLSLQKGDIFAHFRSANGKAIFEGQINTAAANALGIGLTCSTAYTPTPPSGKWFDQPNAIKNTAQSVIGVGIPVRNGATDMKLYCNHVSDPAELLLFSLEIYPGYFQHLAIGMTYKVGAWLGGTIVSGSRSSRSMFTSAWSSTVIDGASNHLFGMAKEASTFLRIDVDAAPIRVPSVLWASAGADSGLLFTGKMMASGVTNLDCLSDVWFPKIPHYGHLQSQTPTDVGRNVNTLNCISVNLPLALYIQRDPDALRNFSQVGYVPGMYSISMGNVAPASKYEVSYPISGEWHQVFPHSHRGGYFGYDGVSIKQ